MLKSDLVRAKVEARRLVPQFLPPGKPDALRLAASLLGAFAGRAGRTRGEIEHACEEIAFASRSLKVARGMAAVLFEVSPFERADGERAAGRRRIVFQRAAAARAAGTFDRARILADSGFEDGEIHPDLRSADRLAAAPGIEPAVLVGLYNLALAEAVLASSVRLEFEIEDDREDVRRRLRERLASARWPESSVEVKGRRFRFRAEAERTRRLGPAVAEVLAEARACGYWRCRATVAWGRSRRRLEVDLGRDDPLPAPGTGPR